MQFTGRDVILFVMGALIACLFFQVNDLKQARYYEHPVKVVKEQPSDMFRAFGELVKELHALEMEKKGGNQ